MEQKQSKSLAVDEKASQRLEGSILNATNLFPRERLYLAENHKKGKTGLWWYNWQIDNMIIAK